jgi:hypothetical protein
MTQTTRRMVGAAVVALSLGRQCAAQVRGTAAGSAEAQQRLQEYRDQIGSNPPAPAPVQTVSAGLSGQGCIKTPEGKPSSYVTIFPSGNAKKTSDPNGSG